MSSLNLERSSVIKPGIYKVRIEDVDDTQAGPSGFINIKLTYNIISSSGQPTGRQVWDNLSMSPKARFKIDKFLDALDYPEEGQVSPKSFRGRSLWVRIDKRKNNNGEMVPDVVAYLTESTMQTIQATEVPDVEYSEEEHSAPREFQPSATLEGDDDEPPTDDVLSSIMDEESEEDVAF